MGNVEALEEGRQAFGRSQWRACFRALTQADERTPLGPEDLWRLGDAAYLIGDDDAAIAAWTRAHHALIELGEPVRAARVCFWLSLCLVFDGKGAQSGGWLSRAQRLTKEAPECAEHGLLRLISGLFELYAGDGAAACACFEQSLDLAGRVRDPDLLALGVLARGQALIQMQQTAEGVVLLDEAMVAVVAGEVSPIAAGIIYCAVISTCERVYDLERAHEWTLAFDDWCGSQPELVAFRGQCLVHRSELGRLRGEWVQALEEAQRAHELLSGRSERLAGRALYQRAELHRLSGEFALAEEAYRAAASSGFEPQPGASLLRLAQGDVEAAASSIRRAASEPGPQRIRILGPFVEIMLAARDREAAHAAADELGRVAADRGTAFIRATAAQSTGALLLASGDAEGALAPLREAWTLWQTIEAHYEAARVRVLIGRACTLLGDRDTAKMHLDAAVSVFERLGAVPDASRLRGASDGSPPVAGLSEREREVLGLVASGKTNRAIAAELEISEHTVARHLSNIFNKLGVTTRTSATAFAFEHGLVQTSVGRLDGQD